MTRSTQDGGFGWPRGIARALAVLALLTQVLAPVAIAPPKGQPVHFGHVHNAHAVHAHAAGEHAAHGVPENAADQHHPDGAECPVCKALQAAGTGIATIAPSVTVAFAYQRQTISASVRAAPLAHVAKEHRARAPPMTA